MNPTVPKFRGLLTRVKFLSESLDAARYLADEALTAIEGDDEQAARDAWPVFAKHMGEMANAVSDIAQSMVTHGNEAQRDEAHA